MASVLLLTACSAGATTSAGGKPTADSTSQAVTTSASPVTSASPATTTSVTPQPPARYKPTVPERTTKNDAGYLINTCVPENLRQYAISLTDSDGTHLSGLVLGSGPKGVLLAHEQGYYICSFLDLGQKLAALGYQVMIPEFRNHGASETVADNDNIDRDVTAALAELHRRGAKQVFLGGASCGGTTVAMAGAKEKDLVGLLIMSSPARCGPLDGVRPIKRIAAPSLFIVAPDDMEGAVEKQVRELYNASGAANKRLLIEDGKEPGSPHGTDLFRRTVRGPVLTEEVLRFIDGCFPA